MYGGNPPGTAGGMEDRMKTGIALYGANGHQIMHLLEQNPRAELAAVAAMNANGLEALQRSIRD